MEFKDIDSALAIVAAAAPGFIIIYVRSLFITGRRPEIKEGLFYYLVSTSIYYAAIIPFAPLSFVKIPIFGFLVFFVTPIFIGCILGVVYQNGVVRRVANRLNLSIVHAAPNSWDYAFSRLRGYTWIRFFLHDERVIHGLFGPSSYVSTTRDGRDIYIEELTTDEFERFPQKTGAWFRESDIAFVEFIDEEVRQQYARQNV